MNEQSLAIAFSYRLHRAWSSTGLSVPYPAVYAYYYYAATDGENSCWIVIDEQAEVVRQIVSLNTGPDEYSIGKIARRLNEEEIAPPAGSKWGTSSVRRS